MPFKEPSAVPVPVGSSAISLRAQDAVARLAQTANTVSQRKRAVVLRERGRGTDLTLGSEGDLRVASQVNNR